MRRSDQDLPHFAQDMSESRAASPPVHSCSAPSSAGNSGEEVERSEREVRFMTQEEQVGEREGKGVI